MGIQGKGERGEGAENGKWRFVILATSSIFLFLFEGVTKSNGVLLVPMAVQLQTTYAVVGFIMSLQYTVGFLACPIVQRIVERLENRKVATAGGVLVSGSMMCTFVATQPLHFGLLFALAGLGEAMLMQTTSVATKEHFGPQYGSAWSFALIASTIGASVLPLLTQELLGAFGVHGTLLVIGGITANLIPAGATIRRPRSHDSSPQSCDGLTRSHDSIPRSRDSITGSRDSIARSRDSPARRRNPTDDTEKLDAEVMMLRDNDKECEEEKRLCCPKREIAILRPFRWLLTFTAKIFALRALKDEPIFSMCFLPCQVFQDLVYGGWSLFAIAHGLSVGIAPDRAHYLLLAGTVGGFVNRLLLTVALSRRPKWSPQFHTACSFILLLSVFLLQGPPSFVYLLGCSFVIGFSAFGCYTCMYAVIGTAVAPRNFPDLFALSCLITGLGMPSAGALTGYMYDVTQSFELVFLIFGGFAVVLFLMSAVHSCLWIRKGASNAGGHANAPEQSSSGGTEYSKIACTMMHENED